MIQHLREVNYLCLGRENFYLFNSYEKLLSGKVYFYYLDKCVKTISDRELRYYKYYKELLITSDLNKAKKFFGLPLTANIQFFNGIGRLY